VFGGDLAPQNHRI